MAVLAVALNDSPRRHGDGAIDADAHDEGDGDWGDTNANLVILPATLKLVKISSVRPSEDRMFNVHWQYLFSKLVYLTFVDQKPYAHLQRVHI